MKKPNIVLLITDCLRYDASKDMNIFKNGKVLNNVYSSAPSTFFAVPSILTGSLPFSIIKNARISKNIYTYLPTVANRLGYISVFITANVVTSRAYGYYVERGFIEDFLPLRKLPPSDFGVVKPKPKSKLVLSLKNKLKNDYPSLFSFSRKIHRYIYRNVQRRLLFHMRRVHNDGQNTSFDRKIRGEKILDEFIGITKSLDKSSPFFAVLHFMDTHMPYGSPKLSPSTLERAILLMKKLNFYGELRRQKEIDFAKFLYWSEVQYLDSVIDMLINYIDREFGLDNTAIISVSDHGEAFGEEGFFSHPDNALIEPVLHVPLVLYGTIDKLLQIKDELISSRFIHEMMVKLMSEGKKEKIKIDSAFYKPVSIGYRKINGLYTPIELSEVTDNGLNHLTLGENKENTKYLTVLLQEERRRILSAELRNNLYGINVPKVVSS